MDSTVIQEIANQLGMAADQAGQFITEQLPAFAALKTIQATVPLVLAWALFLVCAIVSIVAILICRKSVKAEKKRKESDRAEGKITYYTTYNDDYYCYNSWLVFIVSSIFALIVLFFAILITGFMVPDIYGWSNYPEAMLIDMALHAAGK